MPNTQTRKRGESCRDLMRQEICLGEFSPISHVVLDGQKIRYSAIVWRARGGFKHVAAILWMKSRNGATINTNELGATRSPGDSHRGRAAFAEVCNNVLELG